VARAMELQASALKSRSVTARLNEGGSRRCAKVAFGRIELFARSLEIRDQNGRKRSTPSRMHSCCKEKVEPARNAIPARPSNTSTSRYSPNASANWLYRKGYINQ
jgi:hypothetical protein